MGQGVHPSFPHGKWRLGKGIQFTQSIKIIRQWSQNQHPDFPSLGSAIIMQSRLKLEVHSWSLVPWSGFTLVLLNGFEHMKNLNWYFFMYSPTERGQPPCYPYQKSTIRSSPKDATTKKKKKSQIFIAAKSEKIKWNCQYFQGLQSFPVSLVQLFSACLCLIPH